MKKRKQRTKKGKGPNKSDSASRTKEVVSSGAKTPQKKAVKERPVRNIPKRAIEPKGGGGLPFLKYISKAGQFLKESRLELKKVKWPTRKELLAATAVVIILTLAVAFYLGLVDFGLIKIIKRVVG